MPVLIRALRTRSSTLSAYAIRTQPLYTHTRMNHTVCGTGINGGESLWEYSDVVGLFGTAIKMCQEIEVRLTSIFSLGTHFLIKN
eukprot:COSAG03_NODE_16060_length_412_cov_37.261981_2_plen_84_part_01